MHTESLNCFAGVRFGGLAAKNVFDTAELINQKAQVVREFNTVLRLKCAMYESRELNSVTQGIESSYKTPGPELHSDAQIFKLCQHDCTRSPCQGSGIKSNYLLVTLVCEDMAYAYRVIIDEIWLLKVRHQAVQTGFVDEAS